MLAPKLEIGGRRKAAPGDAEGHVTESRIAQGNKIANAESDVNRMHFARGGTRSGRSHWCNGVRQGSLLVQTFLVCFRRNAKITSNTALSLGLLLSHTPKPHQPVPTHLDSPITSTPPRSLPHIFRSEWPHLRMSFWELQLTFLWQHVLERHPPDQYRAIASIEVPLITRRVEQPDGRQVRGAGAS